MPLTCLPSPVSVLTMRAVRRLGSTASLALFACASCGGPAQTTPVSIAALEPSVSNGLGATLPFVEYEAEAAATNGTLIGPDRTYTTLAAEASGRRAVRLQGSGSYIEFTLAKPANAVTVRYAVPDSANGAGLDATLGVMVGGSRVGALATTSRYGWFYGTNPFTNKPADGTPHHFYDEARLMFGQTLAAGTKIRLQVGAGDSAPWYVVDLADFELVPAALGRPGGSISVVDYGADPTGKASSLSAIQAAINAGKSKGQTVWIPAGTFRVDGHLVVDKVKLAGAGPWYSVLRGYGVGIYGNYAPTPSTAVTLQDFAVIGEVIDRNDSLPLSGVGGSLGGGSKLSNLWLQHNKTGVWLDGPFSGVTIAGLRILDNTADGLTFRRGISNAVVQNTFVRNSGDDGLAAWSRLDADHDIRFDHNTVIQPNLANGIAIYGGYSITVSNNVVADTLTQGGGIHIGNRFTAIPISGQITISNNLIARGGSYDPNWKSGVGALWFYALEAPISGNIAVSNLLIYDSSQEGVQFKGQSVKGVTLRQITIQKPSTHAFQIEAPGQMAALNVTASSVVQAAVLGCRPDFAISNQGGNASWLTSSLTCGK